MKTSRIPGFYLLSIEQRIEKLAEVYELVVDEVEALSSQGALTLEQADKMIENAVGIYSLPMGVGANFLINGKEYLVPMAIEEPSVVAAASFGAKIIREAGGFVATSTEPLMIGQIQVVNCPDFAAAEAAVLAAKEALISEGNSYIPNLVARGGGMRDIEVRQLGSENSRYGRMMVVHILVDTCDAMGANLINTTAEGLAASIENLTGGKVYLRILSNLADRRLAKARAVIPPHCFDTKNLKGEEVVEGIVQAQNFAVLDPYRAVTHNKGVMNGVDAVVMATGNDWRSVEAAAHAYAARDGQYRSMTEWYRDDVGNLVGELELPMALGIVGAAVSLHPMAKIALKFARVRSARELAEVCVCVGLAQNLSAIRALATDGIQKGHMALHARTVAMTAGATGEQIDTLAARLVSLRDVSVTRARQLIEEEPASAS
ncbi:hydroxymethylglutaryl-CoA reductase, degradative [bacterium (Candidatus Blackallbacteria) CG17_big_fil_post_rev_8_21_14_2_50_48_46]|uniref:3-hydroxy-3-methylglutaryl coenzyme A reductase n=1 Tax=bacterium (Candidatus Blackallbacteria) CG17_big_fil_post_rev_8_21_14_2_50_48_46 TaxID=2014261 RepID=A0A2M7G8Y3_9BACT|nr:MAG: hydroxymethylglutaryl-CoA reductase, degradative [bacterium (Candidatus Blackallbacteria) CG18_big_fil_WC_8_21_14_2_50_49_26]PIW18555.1 MAG: hydroxymethylglutaryl-CoA reductase, degradative [bacterium (Candidatus Blackallbacteria) CG17_big_fil_post_rev_8_21_14_2_50_48_46]PIW46460.1 MAG: hydroxymethylglutaryl-CoA reductase, degradative [bacterium (Candidatus Blackallbacteria) CG13_big_fil_rev_8_21_14_2_50_49_14]